MMTCFDRLLPDCWASAVSTLKPRCSTAGAAPIPTSSGQVVRHRLNRSGDRQLNRAVHTIVLSRLVHHAETKRYATRRQPQDAARHQTLPQAQPRPLAFPPPGDEHRGGLTRWTEHAITRG